MREIKFRAVTMEGNIIHDIGTIEFFVDGQIIVNDEFPIKQLLQFTGLIDKNGIQVYEGDILRVVYTHSESQEEREYTGQMIWDNKNLRYRLEFIEQNDDTAKSQVNYTGELGMFVIGNVYENPELLHPKGWEIMGNMKLDFQSQSLNAKIDKP